MSELREAIAQLLPPSAPRFCVGGGRECCELAAPDGKYLSIENDSAPLLATSSLFAGTALQRVYIVCDWSSRCSCRTITIVRINAIVIVTFVAVDLTSAA